MPSDLLEVFPVVSKISLLPAPCCNFFTGYHAPVMEFLDCHTALFLESPGPEHSQGISKECKLSLFLWEALPDLIILEKRENDSEEASRMPSVPLILSVKKMEGSFDERLTMSCQCALTARKANAVLGRTNSSRAKEVILPLRSREIPPGVLLPVLVSPASEGFCRER